jgi:predicted ATP-dependent serine protease
LQKLQPHKALILIKGPKHTSKSQLAMQIGNAFGESNKAVAYVDYEQGGVESKDTVDSINRNTTPKGRELIAIKGYLEQPLKELKELCKYCSIIIADSVTDLRISADQLNDLRNLFPKVIWCFISQVKENGEMYGGGKMAHNPTMIIECHPSENPTLRYATLEKNRGNDTSLMYSIYHKKLIKTIPTSKTENIKK